ncbi:MFS transporter [Luedemannella helvata]|uniref:MFS transporter n=1 Tax=Luedemannella helvata TaxID=349315 RepID=A0ABP4X390_9ACTN
MSTDKASRAATFGELFAIPAYRYLLVANVLSWLGDYVAKAAITTLVFHSTGSVGLSALAFGITYLPWLVGGPLLASIAERRPYRSVMVGCDLVRALLMALLAVPGLPVGLILVLVFVAELASPPFQAARSALLPQILKQDRYVVGVSLQASSGQAAQVAGYAIGALLAVSSPRAALIANSLTFVVSATLLRLGLGTQGSVAASSGAIQHLGRDTMDGFRVVFGSPVLRAVAVLVFSVMLFASVPEGLAAAWAVEVSESRADLGWIQGAIMMAGPLGFILGGLVVGRLVRPDLRRQLVQPFSVLAPLALVPAFADPPAALLVTMCAVCGFSVAGMMPAANGLFVQALPPDYRARAFGVMQGGVQLAQGVGLVATGTLADRYGVSTVVGGWSVAGALLLVLIWLRWPRLPHAAHAIADKDLVSSGRSAGGQLQAPPTRTRKTRAARGT